MAAGSAFEEASEQAATAGHSAQVAVRPPQVIQVALEFFSRGNTLIKYFDGRNPAHGDAPLGIKRPLYETAQRVEVKGLSRPCHNKVARRGWAVQKGGGGFIPGQGGDRESLCHRRARADRNQ